MRLEDADAVALITADAFPRRGQPVPMLTTALEATLVSVPALSPLWINPASENPIKNLVDFRVHFIWKERPMPSPSKSRPKHASSGGAPMACEMKAIIQVFNGSRLGASTDAK